MSVKVIVSLRQSARGSGLFVSIKAALLHGGAGSRFTLDVDVFWEDSRPLRVHFWRMQNWDDLVIDPNVKRAYFVYYVRVHWCRITSDFLYYSLICFINCYYILTKTLFYNLLKFHELINDPRNIKSQKENFCHVLRLYYNIYK